MNVLGLQFGHDGSAAIARDGKLLAAISTERLTRVKKDRGVPDVTLDYVLRKAGMTFGDIDMVAGNNIFWQHGDVAAPTEGPEGYRFAPELYGANSAEGDRRFLMGVGSAPFFDHARMYTTVTGVETRGRFLPCLLSNHELCHCYYTFVSSPYRDAVAVALDGSDGLGNDFAAAYYHQASDSSPSVECAVQPAVDSWIGSLYNTLCDYLGFYPSLTDAGKVMALAALGTPLPRWERWLMSFDRRHRFTKDDSFISIVRALGRALPNRFNYGGYLPHEEGGEADPDWLKKEDWNSEVSRNVAATAQALLEAALMDIYENLAGSTNKVTRNICLSGGTMLNCVANGKLLNSGLFENVFVAPACGDDGLAIGSALYASNRFDMVDGRLVEADRIKTPHTPLEVFEGGRRYSEPEIGAAIEQQAAQINNAQVRVWRADNEAQLLQHVAGRIADGYIIGWFYRGSELGPRALGHRSILSDARRPDMKDILNARVKHRESFRPFAPVVLAEVAHDWFELPANALSPFMLFSVKCLKPDRVPSGVHVDNTARVQTVDPQNNGRFYDLIVEFNRQTGTPVILNTSFNVMGEPIVETPQDAIRCFLSTNIDLLVLEDRILEKPLAPAVPFNPGA